MEVVLVALEPRFGHDTRILPCPVDFPELRGYEGAHALTAACWSAFGCEEWVEQAGACSRIPISRNLIGEAGQVSDPEIRGQIGATLERLASAVKRTRTGDRRDD